MKNKLLALITLVIVLALALVLYKNGYLGASKQTDGQRHFSYIGMEFPFSKVNIENKDVNSFYVATGEYGGETRTFYFDADIISQAVLTGNEISDRNGLIVELLPEWTSDSKYELRFRSEYNPFIFTECEGKVEECYLEEIKNYVTREMNELTPDKIDSAQVAVEKKDYDVIVATIKKRPDPTSSKDDGCHPINFRIIRYENIWYTLSSEEMCIL